MRKKGSSWTGWRKQLKQYVTSGGKLPAVVQQQVNGENVIMKEVEDDSVNDHSDMLQQQHVGDRSSTEPPSSCEDVKSDDASQTREEKQQQLRACIKADAAEDHAQLALAHFSPLTPPRPNSGSAPQTISPPTPSSRSTPNPAGVATSAVLKKGAFKHVYRSGPVRKLSSRTKTSAAATTAGVRTSGGVEQETMAATAIQAAFRGYRSRRNSSEDVWSQAGAVYCNNRRLEKELQGQTTQASSCTQTYVSQTADPHLEFSNTADNKLNINGEWDTDTRSPADIEASAQYKQEAALKRERAREYALALRRLKYGLEQHKGGAKAASGTPPPTAAADCTNTMLDKPGYVMNWLERAQGARDDHHVPKKVSDGTRNLLPASKSLSPKTTGVVTDGAEKAQWQSSGEKDKPERMKLQNGEKLEKSNSNQKGVSSSTTAAAVAEARTPRRRNGDASERAFDTNEHLQEHSSPATSSFACPTPNHGTRRLSFTNGTAAGHTGKGTGTVNNERRKSVGSCVSPAPMVLPPTAATDRRLSSPFAGMKAPLHSTTPKKLPFKV